MKILRLFFLVACLSGVYEVFAQAAPRYQGDIKLLFDLNVHRFSVLSNARIVVSFNPIFFLWKNNIFVSPSPSLSFQTGRGIAMSMIDKGVFNKGRGHAMLSVIVGGQWGDNGYIHQIQNSSQYLSTGVYSDCRNVATVSSNLIYQFKADRNDDKGRCQVAGNIFVGLSSFEVTYMNDGPPFPKPFADGKDRWWTGSGFLGFTTRQNWQTNPFQKNLSFRLSYDRYTGYTKNAFELANDLKMDYSLHGEDGEHLFNRGSMRLGAFNNFASVEINANDDDILDVQYWIHKIRGQSLHRTINKSTCSFQVGFNPLNIPQK